MAIANKVESREINLYEFISVYLFDFAWVYRLIEDYFESHKYIWIIKLVFFKSQRPFTPYCILNFRSFLISTQPKTNILSLVHPEWINWNGLYNTKDSFRFPPLSSSLSMISRDLLYQTEKIWIENCKRKWPFFHFEW